MTFPKLSARFIGTAAMFFNNKFHEKYYQKFITLRFFDEKSFQAVPFPQQEILGGQVCYLPNYQD